MRSDSYFMSNQHNRNNTQAGQDEALKLIKARIDELYDQQPQPAQPTARSSAKLVDRFWQSHRDHPDKSVAWQAFYEGLDNKEKQLLWDEHHAINADTSTPSTTQDTPHALPEHSVQPRIEPVDKEDDLHVKKTVYGQFVIPGQEFQPSNRLPEPEPEPAPLDPVDAQAEHSQNLEPEPALGNKRIPDKESLLATKEKLIANMRRQRLPRHITGSRSRKRHWGPLFISITVGVLILFAQYNQVIFALAKQYVSPGDSLRSPVIIDPNASIEVGPESRIIIPKINVDVPVVYNLGTRDEATIQNALEDGVVHYHQTSLPGQAGNNVIVGHSSNNFLNSGKYKFAFVLLDRLELNDTLVLHHEGTRYVYKVTNKQVVEPTDFSLTTPTAEPTVTLITCTPPGTSWRRLIVQAVQISPAPSDDQLIQGQSTTIPEDTPERVPGNSPSLWSRIF